MPKISKKQLYCILAIAVVVSCLAATMIFKHFTKPVTKGETVPLVRTMTVQFGSTANQDTYSGEVRGRYESQLAFQVSGKIIKRNVDLGSVVHTGDVLFEIDAKDVQQTVNIGSAQVYSAESQLQLAQNNLDRYRELYENGAVSRAVYDQYQSAYDSAVAAVRQTSAQYSQGLNQLGYTALYADSDGVVSNINAEVGQVVAAGQQVLTLVKSGELEIEMSVPENKVEQIRNAGSLQISFWALPGMITEGTVREISPIADKVSRTYKVRVSIVNPPANIKLGMTATVAAGSVGRQQAVYIPLSAIYQNGDTPNVWIVEDGQVTLRPVKLGNFGDNTVEVREGLQAGDVVVTAGVHKLTEGQKVNKAGDKQ